MELIAQYVSSIGFPIVAFWLIFEYMKQRDKDQTEERKLFTVAINNNTDAINKLTSKIIKGGIDPDEKE